MRGALWGFFAAMVVGCAPARAAVFVDRVEEGRAVLVRCEGEVCREEDAELGALAEGDVLVGERPSRAARAQAEARVRALRQRLGARPLEASSSLERAP